MKLRWLCAVALVAGAVPAVAAEPVRHIGIHVQPFYEAALTPMGGRRFPSASNTTLCSAPTAVRTSLPHVT